MRNRLRTLGPVLCGGLVLALVTAHAGEIRYAARLDQSVWRVQASQTQCVLSHAIPDYGQARFIRRPGQGLGFSIDLPVAATLAESAVVRAVPPPWKHNAVEQDLSIHPVPLSADTLALDEADARAMYAALERGMYVEIAYRPGTDMVVVLSVVRFLEVADDFQACEASLSKDAVVNVTKANARATKTHTANAGTSGKSRSLGKPDVESASAMPTDMAIADATVKFEGPDDKFSETVLITLTGIAREFVLQKRHAGLKVVISGATESDAVYQKRASAIKTYLANQGLPADRIQILKRGQLPTGKNIQPEAPSANALRVHLTR